MISFLRLLLVFALSAIGFAHAADERTLSVQSGKAAERRVALVIGNSAYPGAPLKNPVNDARDMASALRKLGFDVIEKSNITQKEMNRAIAQFGEKLRADTVALFYYAGHGMQVKGKNYLLPIDAQIASEASARAETVDVDTVMDQLAVSPMNIVILDACRNNPFERKFRSAGGGLAQMDAPRGSLIAYATAPGKVANDGDGKNGLYTQELLKHIQTPGLPLEAVFKRVRNGVVQGSGEAQTPWEASSLTGDFYFLPGTGGQSAPATQVASISPQLAGARTAAQIEDELWDAIKDSDKAGVFEEYIKQYPKGRYLALARVRIAGLRDAAKPLPSAVPPAPTLAVSGARDDPETALWTAVSQSGGSDDYDVYLKQYPKGKYAGLARQRMKKAQEQAANAAYQMEQDAWTAAEAGNTEDSYNRYLKAYPKGRYSALVPPRLVRLKSDDAIRQERELWKKAESATVRSTVQAYLERYPSGAFADAARAKLIALEKEDRKLAGTWMFRWSDAEGEMQGTLDIGSPSDGRGYNGKLDLRVTTLTGNLWHVIQDATLTLNGDQLLIHGSNPRIISQTSRGTYHADSFTLSRTSATEFRGHKNDAAGSRSANVTMVRQ